MSIEASIDPDESFVMLAFTGTTSSEDWDRTLDSVLAHPHFRPGMPLLFDRRNANDVPTTAYIKRVLDYVELHARELQGCRWAGVASDPATYGMARMAEQLNRDGTVSLRAFMSVEEARSWFLEGLPPAAHPGSDPGSDPPRAPGRVANRT